MKSDGHLEDVSTIDVLQITTRSASRKSLNIFHNMNMQTKLVFAGDWDIHIDMSLCLCHKRLAWFGWLIYMNNVLSWCLKINLNWLLRYYLTTDLSTITNLDLTWWLMICFGDCWFALISMLCGHNDLCGYSKKWFCICLLIPSTMVEVLIVVIQHEIETYMIHPWCMHLHLVT